MDHMESRRNLNLGGVLHLTSYKIMDDGGLYRPTFRSNGY